MTDPGAAPGESATAGPDRPPSEGDSFLWRLVLVALLGAAVGAVTWVFLRAVHDLEHLVWIDLPEAVPLLGDNPRLTTVLLCTLGGVLVGLVHMHRPLPTGLDESLEEIEGEPGDLANPDAAPLSVVTARTPLMPAALVAAASLAFGASLGPEAPLVVIIVGLVKRIGQILHRSGLEEVSAAAALGGLFLGSLGPAVLMAEVGRDEPSGARRSQRMAVVLLGSMAGALTFRVLPAPGGIQPYVFPDIGATSGVGAYGWAMAAGLLGAMAGGALRRMNHPIAAMMATAMPSVLVRASVAGLVMGLMGAVAPLVLFNGMDEAQELIDNLPQYTAAYLLLLGGWKLLATSVVLGGRFMGGEVFPAIFAGISMALALTVLGAPTGAVAAAGAAGACTAALGRPVVSFLLLLLFFRADLIIFLAVGTVVAATVGAVLQGGAARDDSAPATAPAPGS